MSGVQTGAVVVGVDGSVAGSAAVRYAASEAMREDAPLHIVHVLPRFIPLSPMLPLDSMDTIRDVGERIVDAARSEAEKVGGYRVRVTTVVLDGPRTPTLLAESENARVIVLGHAGPRCMTCPISREAAF
jgi:nucleotide-binding universal stress UspA family protein